MPDVLLDIRDLRTTFAAGGRRIAAVEGIDLKLHRGEVLGLVGESGCGKSVAALSIMRLLPADGARVSADKMEFCGVDLQTLTEQRMSEIRGNEISIIFQEPQTALNPVITIGAQIMEAIQIHAKISRHQAGQKAVKLLELVQIPDAGRRFHHYPHQLSGGMLQRVMMAMALACGPLLLIADEPTAALDATIQAQIIDMLSDLQKRLGMAILLISHDLGIMAKIAQRIMVLYAGVVVEQAEAGDLFTRPLHPYTQSLLDCLPRLGDAGKRLRVTGGMAPDSLNRPAGCRFHPRCPQSISLCRQLEPPLFSQCAREVRCWLYRDVLYG